MEIKNYIETYLADADEGLDALASRAGLGRMSIYRAKSGKGCLSMATVRKLVEAVGKPLVILPSQRSSEPPNATLS